MLLDTSGLFAFLDARDHNHVPAADYLNAAAVRLTHSYVLAELVALAVAKRIDRAATLRFVQTIADHADFDAVWVTEADHREAVDLRAIARTRRTPSVTPSVSLSPTTPGPATLSSSRSWGRRR
jgi:predicted nucleic acid-binding protein